MLFAAFAQYLTDSFLRTDVNRAKTTSTHEIDLSALYGRTTAQTDALRRFDQRAGWRGRLKSQCINGEEYPHYLFENDGITVKNEFRVLDHPLRHVPTLPHVDTRKIFAVGGDRANSTPQIAMVNTLFLREHNRVAKLIERDNRDWTDEQVFQTARNILIAMFIKIVVEDYINHISTIAFPLRADPSMAWEALWNRPNWMTVEFTLLYRWHSLIPDRIIWNGQPVDAVDMTLDNSFLLDIGLARALDSASRQPARAIGLLNTPDFLREVERATIQMGRTNRLRSYNDYRVAFGEQRVDRFEQITGDPDRVAALKARYNSPNDVDFYTGLFAEDPVPNSPVPQLIGRMLAVDAFSQGMTNPLLSKHVFNEATFTRRGFRMIRRTRSLRQLAIRNIRGGLRDNRVSFTRADWTREYYPLGWLKKLRHQWKAKPP